MKRYQNFFNDDCIIAPHRNKRPFINKGDVTCPFCLINEVRLSRIIDESWQADELFVRIVPNLYPITSEYSAQGVHDVIIDTHHHMLHPKDFSEKHWEVLLRVMQKRWHQLMADTKINFIQIFKNYGVKAGASISHSHWQLVALEKVPYSLQKKLSIYHEAELDDTCYLCDLIHIQEGTIIFEDDLWEVWVPPIPQFTYEVWLIPKKHYQHYGQLELEEIKRLGKLIKYLLQTYHQLNPEYDFNICFMSGDLKSKYPYHFYVKVVIRIGQIAGFEISTGCSILTVSPKTYSEQMKKILGKVYK